MTHLFLKRSGELTLALLIISATSGFLMAYQYDPALPFISTVYIDSLLPFGSFFRALHFWSSQGFFLMLIWHTFVNHKNSLKDGYQNKHTGSINIRWLILTSTIFLGIYALFSGYILRFDQTGRDAAKIAEHLFLGIPIFGHWIDRLFLALRDEGVNRVYAVHILFTFILWLLGTWYHLRRTIMRGDAFLLAFFFAVLISLSMSAPLDPEDTSLDIVKGPWFFLGVQELLRHIPPILAGVLFPLIPIFATGALGIEAVKRPSMVILSLWTGFYALLTFMAILR